MKNILTFLIVVLICVVVGASGLWVWVNWPFPWFQPPVAEVAPADVEAIRAGPAVEVGEDDWPWWRGPTRDGIARGQLPPTTWSQTENILWSVEIPGRAHASPIVVGDRIFVANADEGSEVQSLLCYDRATGDKQWEKEVHQGGFPRIHSKNSHASATPACDGEAVFTAFIREDGLWVSALDFEGKILWQEKAGPFLSRHGFGASPVIYKSLVIVAGDHRATGYLTALDRKTGKIVWRKNRGDGDTYATPTLGKIASRPQLVLTGHNRVTSYDPASGELLWERKGPADTTANTVAFNDTHVFASGGYPTNGILCIRGDGEGNLDDSYLTWENGNRVYVPSMVARDGVLFTVEDTGIARFYDSKTGKQLWTKRLRGEFSASPVLIGDRLYVPNEEGTTYVIAAAAPFKVLARNDLGDRCFATPVICGGKIYQRTGNHLYCIGTK
jgi:outer membrane protein assembly factor BamB